MMSYRSLYQLQRITKLGFVLMVFGILVLFFGIFFGVHRDNTSTLRWAGVFMLDIALAIGIATLLRVLIGWSHRDLRIDCPSCHKSIRPNEPWRCGFCDQVNESAPVCGRCKYCKRSATAIQCANPDCQTNIPLSSASNRELPAVTIRQGDDLDETPARIDALRDERLKMEAQISNIEVETVHIKALAKRKEAEGLLVENEPPNIEARLRQLLQLKLELPVARKRLVQELGEKYSDDPENLKTALGNLKAVVEDMRDSDIYN